MSDLIFISFLHFERGAFHFLLILDGLKKWKWNEMERFFLFVSLGRVSDTDPERKKRSSLMNVIYQMLSLSPSDR